MGGATSGRGARGIDTYTGASGRGAIVSITAGGGGALAITAEGGGSFALTSTTDGLGVVTGAAFSTGCLPEGTSELFFSGDGRKGAILTTGALTDFPGAGFSGGGFFAAFFFAGLRLSFRYHGWHAWRPYHLSCGSRMNRWHAWFDNGANDHTPRRNNIRWFSNNLRCNSG